jgi:CheY-like chemotaxis protein
MAGFGLFKRLFGGDSSERRSGSRKDASKGALVLVVDDSATIRAVIGKMLAQDGHVVLKAAEGESAIAMAREMNPDLIFLDIVMPGMNGFAVLRALRRDPVTHHIPIVMISGNLQATEQFYVQRFGADDFMKKPFGRGEVFARIQHLTKTGRLVIRDRPAEPVVAVESEHDPLNHDAIPDVAMPDPQDQLAPDHQPD